MGTTVRAGAAQGLLEMVAARGGSPARVLADAGLASDDLADVDRLLAVERLVALQNAAARELDDEDFGFEFGRHRDLRTLGVLGYAIRHAPTVGAALRNLDRYSVVHMQRGRMRLARSGAHARIVFEISLDDYEHCRHYTEATAALGQRFLRQICGPDWRPLRLRFGHRRPRNLRAREQFFGARLLFEQPVHMECEFAARDLERRVADADPVLLQVVERHLEARVGEDSRGAWLADVRRATAEALSSGNASVRALSGRLGLSARTLQRRLEAHQLSFRRLVAEVRREVAEQYLGRSDLSLGEVAFLLGYSDLSSFHRAFRRWSGTTPLERRKCLIAPPSSY